MLKREYAIGVVVWLVVGVSWAATIEIESVAARRGAAVETAVVLHTDGEEVAGTENIIDFDGEVYPLECWGNPAIDKDVIAFASSPSGCVAGDCDSLKALVLSVSNTSPIPDGSILYWCLVRVSPSAESGDHLLECANPGSSTLAGGPVETSCVDGVVTVLAEPPIPTMLITPRPTPTPFSIDSPRPTHTRPPTPTLGLPTRTRTPSSLRRVFLSTSSPFVSADHGGRLEIRVTVLDSNNQPIDGIDVHFDREPPVGELEPRSVRTGTIEIGGRSVSGVAFAALEILPDTPEGQVVIQAEVQGGVGQVTVTLFSGNVPPVTATPTPQLASQVTTIFMETEPYSIPAGLGGPVLVRAIAFDSNNEPVDAVNLLFSFSPEVGTLRPISTVTRTIIEDGGRVLSGVAEILIDVPPGQAQPGTVIVAASSATAQGSAQFSVVPGDAERSVSTVLLETLETRCGSDNGGPINMRAIVFDEDNRPLDGVNVLFLTDLGLGRFFPLFQATDIVNEQGGVAATTLEIPPGAPVRIDPTTGAILPYVFRARAGGVEGIAQVFIVPGGEACDGSSPPPTLLEDSDDGCSVSRAGSGPNAAMIILPFALLVLRIRRRRVLRDTQSR